jgi:hypothetical protein
MYGQNAFNVVAPSVAGFGSFGDMAYDIVPTQELDGFGSFGDMAYDIVPTYELDGFGGDFGATDLGAARGLFPKLRSRILVRATAKNIARLKGRRRKLKLRLRYAGPKKKRSLRRRISAINRKLRGIYVKAKWLRRKKLMTKKRYARIKRITPRRYRRVRTRRRRYRKATPPAQQYAPVPLPLLRYQPVEQTARPYVPTDLPTQQYEPLDTDLESPEDEEGIDDTGIEDDFENDEDMEEELEGFGAIGGMDNAWVPAAVFATSAWLFTAPHAKSQKQKRNAALVSIAAGAGAFFLFGRGRTPSAGW